MDIKQIAIEKLIPYEKNNKEHDEIQITRIANSIKEFGFIQPLVIDKNNVVVIGHWRLDAAKELGLETVPAIMAENLDEEQIKKLRILDNKLNESDWHLENLKIELDDLGQLDIGDLNIDIKDMIPEFDAPEFNPDEYDEEEENKTKMVACTVWAKDLDEAGEIKEAIEEIGYECVVKG